MVTFSWFNYQLMKPIKTEIMKTLILTIAITLLNLVSNVTKAQSYTTESKSCGACQKEVSINSRPGMTCPHCGARWGRENTTHTQSSYTSYDYNSYNNYYTSASPISNCNIRSYPSTSAEILAKASTYNTFEVIEVGSNWVKVKLTIDTYYGTETSYGWIHRSLVFLS